MGPSGVQGQSHYLNLQTWHGPRLPCLCAGTRWQSHSQEGTLQGSMSRALPVTLHLEVDNAGLSSEHACFLRWGSFPQKT